MLRDGHTCQLRIPGVCTEVADQVHHVIGKGISELDADLVASCQACNLKIGQPNSDPPHKVTTW
jgi:hypothetical protein